MKISKNHSSKVSLHGFTAAVQVWVYEVFPNVGRNFALKLEWRENSFPRILRWDATRCPSREEVIPHFSARGGLEMMRGPLFASYEKLVARKLEYNDCASVEAVRKKPRVVEDEDAIVSKKVEAVRRSPIVRRSTKRHISPATSTNRCISIDDKGCEGESNNDIMLTLGGLIQTVNEVHVCCKSNNMILKRLQQCFISEKSNGRDTVRRSSFPGPMTTQRPHLGSVMKSVKPISSGVYKISKTSVIPKTSSKVVDHLKKLGASMLEIMPGYCAPPPILPKHQMIPDANMFDPNKAGYDPDDLKEFLEWYQNDDASDIIELTSDMVKIIDKKWFDDIWQREATLGDDHIDALTHLLMIKKRIAPGYFMGKWTVMEQVCWGFLSESSFEAGAECVMGYVRGVYPTEGGSAWENVDKIYGVEHVNDNH